MAKPLPPTLGQLLRRHREAANLTQEELADRAGLSARDIGDIECGRIRGPHVTTLARLADALALPTSQRALFGGAAVRRRGPRRSAPPAQCAQASPRDRSGAPRGGTPRPPVEGPDRTNGAARDAGPARPRLSWQERRAWALDHLRLVGSIGPGAYTAALSVDRKTARRDLSALAAEGLAQAHGTTSDRCYALRPAGPAGEQSPRTA